MRKSFKLAAACLFVASAVTMPTVNVEARNSQLSPLISGWAQRSASDVAQSINQELAHSDVYTVQWGDTLSTIARVMGLTTQEIVALNQIDNPDLILAGSVLSFNHANHSMSIAPSEDAAPEEEVTISLDTGEEIPTETAEEVPVETAVAEVTLENEVEELVAEEQEPVAETEDAFFETASEVEETPAVEEAVVIEEAPVVEETSEVENTWEPAEEEVTYEEPAYTETPASTETEVWTPVEETEYEEPVYEEPVYEEPVVEEPVYEEPAAPQGPMDSTTAFNTIVAEKGLSQSEIDGWSMIITRESGWNHTIANPSSGAYGLPQALPGNKMASHGADWATNPYTQLSWMYDYMIGRYGSIQGAVNFWNANHWY